jgi:hypothetical protein
MSEAQIIVFPDGGGLRQFYKDLAFRFVVPGSKKAGNTDIPTKTEKGVKQMQLVEQHNVTYLCCHSRNGRKKARRSSTRSSGSSSAGKCPPLGICVQRTTL